MDNLSLLKASLRSLAAEQNKNFDSPLFTSQLQEIIENNDFDDATYVPDWLTLFFDALISKKTISKTPYVRSQGLQGDVSNFLAELEDIIDLQWRDTGEETELIADKLQMFGIISIEDDTYQVGRLKV